MNAIEQLQTLKIPVGAKPGQAILFVDLTEVDHASTMLTSLQERGYTPQIRYLELPAGVHVIATLKEESGIDEQRREELTEEWATLATELTPSDPNKAIRLWCGQIVPNLVHP
jgi:hypothetical protein